MTDLKETPEALSTTDSAQEPSSPILGPIPSSFANSISSPATFRVLVPDEAAIVKLLEDLLNASGMSVKAAARNLGVQEMSIRQYTRGRRSNPSVVWLLKFANMCGFEVIVRRRKA